MKSMIAISALLLSLSAGAQQQDLTCYTITLKQGQHITAAVPVEICLEFANLDLGKNRIEVKSSQTPELFQDMQLTRFMHSENESYEFQGLSQLFQTSDAACTAMEDVKLKLTGTTGADRFVNVGNLDFTVVRTYTENSCTSPVLTETYVYKLRD